MQKIKIQWYEKSPEAISQIYSKGLEYAIATKKKQCSHFIYCKDFLQDAVWATLNDTLVNIYSFVFNPKEDIIDINDLTRILIANESDEFFNKKIPNCIDFLNQIEKTLHLKRTVAYECEDPPRDYLPGGVFLLEGSQRWMRSSVLLSMYTLFIRCGFVHKIGDDYMTTITKIIKGDISPYQENDQDFLNDSFPGIKAIFALGYRKIFYKDMKKNYPKDIELSDLHHRCGIRAFSWGETKNYFPYWNRSALLEMLKVKGVEIEDLWKLKSLNALNDLNPDKGAFTDKESKGESFISKSAKSGLKENVPVIHPFNLDASGQTYFW